MPSTAMPHIDLTPHDIEDVSDTASSIGSGDWTDLSSAHPDDVSDAASLDGDDRTRPVSSMGALDDGSEEAWTTAEASTSPAASLYASAHAPLNPFEHETSSALQRPVHTPEAHPAYGMYGPLDPFRAPSDAGSGQSERTHASSNVHDLQLILPDPLERSESTVAPDLSFSDDAVLATGPAIVVSLAGVSPSVAQRATVVADVLRAIAKATYSSYVRPDYRNFTTLSDLPKRIKVDQEQAKEISVLVCDHTNDPHDHSHDDAPSILVAFTSDLHHSHFPQIPIQSILVPVVVNDAAGPVVLFDERDDRAVDETAVDVDDLVRRLSNSFAADHHSETATQTAVDTFDGRSLVSDDLDEALLNTDYDTPDERSDRKLDERVPPKHESAPRVIQDLSGPELADALKHAARTVSPRWATACALAVMLSLLLGTGHLIRTARPSPSPTTAPTAVTVLDPIPTAQTSLALRSPHTSLAPKSPHTALAVKSPQTALAVKSTQTALAKVSHVPINESCSSDIISSSSSSVAKAASSSTTTSLSTTTPATSMALTTTPASTPTSTSTSTCIETERARTLASVAEDLTGALDRIERLLGWNVRQTLGKAEAASKAFVDATNRANIVLEATAIEAAEVLYDSHQNARKNAQRKLATIKRGVNIWGEKVGLANSNEDVEGTAKNDAKGKAKAQGVKEKKDPKGKKRAKENVKPRPGREKWQTSKDKAAREEKAKGKSCKGKVPFPNREEQERAQTAGRGKRPTQEPTWTWSVEEWTEYEPLNRPRSVIEEVREYIHHGFVF
ncbi:hypothetical protein FRC08_010193 [Ceratobasidium sp. 394]|nr:hypothetical protein FRC08_010193 [Ceratobasidium sp. 394]